MGLFTFILCFLLLLLVLIIIGSIQEFTLWSVTRKEKEFVTFLIPAFLSFVTFGILLLVTHLLLKKFNIDDLNIVYSIFMKWDYNFHNYIIVIFTYVACSTIFILLQAIFLKLSNISYYKFGDFIKHKILKKEKIKELSPAENENLEGKISVDLTHNNLPVKHAKISFFYYLSASIFTFALIFFAILLFICLGAFLGKKYIL